MAAALALNSWLPGPAVTRDVGQKRGARERRCRQSFRRFLQEFGLVISPPMDELLPVDGLGVLAHVVVDAALHFPPISFRLGLVFVAPPTKKPVTKNLGQIPWLAKHLAQACIVEKRK